MVAGGRRETDHPWYRGQPKWGKEGGRGLITGGKGWNPKKKTGASECR